MGFFIILPQIQRSDRTNSGRQEETVTRGEMSLGAAAVQIPGMAGVYVCLYVCVSWLSLSVLFTSTPSLCLDQYQRFA